MEYAGTSRPGHFRAMTPQVAGAVFAVTLAFMLLFPFVRLSLDGAGEPATLLFLTKTDFGLNIFALVLLLVPVAGIVASLALRENMALLADAVIAAIGVVMIPLTILTLGHAAGGNTLLASHVSVGMAVIPVSIMLCVLALSSGLAAFQAGR
ncbi:MAG: hypothetical protein ABI229_05920 [Gemmatimonadaceae bacterium]